MIETVCDPQILNITITPLQKAFTDPWFIEESIVIQASPQFQEVRLSEARQVI